VKEEAEDEDDSAELVHVSYLQAVNAVNLLMKYFEQSNLAMLDDMQPLSAIKQSCRLYASVLLNTAKDHKGLHRTAKDPQKDRKGPQRIFVTQQTTRTM